MGRGKDRGTPPRPRQEDCVPLHPLLRRLLLGLAHHVFGEPDPASGIHHDSDAYTMQRGARQVDAVPACWRLIDHALLYAVYTGPGCWIGACQADILAAIGEARETFVGDACALIKSIGTGMAETTVNHVPAMQSCTPGKCIIPNKWIKTPNSTIMVDQRKKLLSQLYFFCG